MSERLSTTVVSLAWVLAACHRGAGPESTEPSPEAPGVVTEAEGPAGAKLPIVVVPQLQAFAYEDWSFEPGGARLASDEHGDCSVWDVDTGRLIRSFEDEEGPCEEWAPLVGFPDFQLPESSADDQLVVDVSAKVAIVDAESGQKLRELACSNCAEADEVSWSREGHQLALAWRDEARLEIWDADSGTRERVESIPIDGELYELEIGWTEGGATVAWIEVGAPVECDEYDYSYGYDCEWDEAMQVSVRRSRDLRILVAAEDRVELSHVGTLDGIGELQFDAEGRWAIWTTSYSARRMGSSSELHVAGMTGGTNELGWVYEDNYAYGYTGTIESEGHWRSDGATHWAVWNAYAEGSPYASELLWQTTLVSPPLGWREGSIAEGLDYNSEFNLAVLGFVGDSLRRTGELCDESCTQLGVAPPPDCVIMDGASGHGTELIDCAGSAFLRNAGGLVPLPVDSVSVDWWWSRGGAVVIYDGDEFAIYDAAAGVGTPPRTDVLHVFDAKLGPELDRMVVVTVKGTELIDLTSGAAISTLDDLEAEQVALSPKADRLAVLERGQLRVVDLASGETLARAAVEGDELAFRQDGEVIYVGSGQPEIAIVASTGQRLVDSASEAVLVAIDDAISAGGELDPSWRWIMDEEMSELVRTIDGRRLRVAGGAWWLPDTGQYANAPPGPEFAFRFGTDPWSVPEFDARDLAKWLERPDLFEEFVAGEPIPAPMISAPAASHMRTMPDE